jgi:ribosome biogenesis protein ERB1
MARKKMRGPGSSGSELRKPRDDQSPVVSDDDGIEAGENLPSTGEDLFAGDVEFLSDGNDSEYDGCNAEETIVDITADHRQQGDRAPDKKSQRQRNSSNALAATRGSASNGQGLESLEGEESDSSSDGDLNPVGNIPMRWYDGYDHIGYSRDGAKIVRANKPSALELAADPHAWRRVYDDKNDQEIVLSHEELHAIARMRAGRYPSASGNPETDEIIAWSGPIERHPLTSGPEPKRRFLPSRHEARTVMKMVRAIRAGTLKPPSERARELAERDELQYNFDVWAQNQPKDVADMSKSERARDIMRVPAPKVALPKHDESYNPPEEYLPSPEEKLAWENKDPEDRRNNYLPSKYNALRHVPLYANFIKERFERCLDLYLAVRVRKDPDTTNPDDLIPKLPSPRDLRPFPSGRSSSFGPLPSRARSICIHPRGQWLLSGSDDGAVRIWEVLTGRLRHTWLLGQFSPQIDNQTPPITCVSWCPVEGVYVFAATIGTRVFVVSAAEALGVSTVDSHALINSVPDDQPVQIPDGIVWEEVNASLGPVDGANAIPSSRHEGLTLCVTHPRPLRMVTWHSKGDYFASVGKDSTGGTVAIHRLSRRSSQLPFKRKTAGVQTVRFHPTRPFFFVATMHNIRIYNLAAQEAVKTLKPGVRWISSMEIHHSGDHVLVGSYDKKLCWFDLDLSTLPYKTIRNHEYAVRTAKFHPRLPLFADASDDGSSHVFHGTVYDDLNKNALIVPLKKLDGAHVIANSLGVLDIAWHPRLPWLFTSGADGQIHLFTDTS